MKRVMFYVQHLLGIGHVVRSTRMAKALAAGGFDVSLVCGGPPIAGLDAGWAKIVQLPPVTAGDSGFSDLVDQAGAPLTDAGKAARCAALLAQFEAIQPDVLLIEAFPFGRRQMRFELLPLLERAVAAKPRPLIACSVRDILQQERRPGRAEGYAELVERYFDLVLVHGDPALATFGASYPLADRIARKIRYTGMVGPGKLAPAGEQHDVIVSAGGGAVGEGVLRAALAARPLSRLAKARWLVVTGPNMPAAMAAQWQGPDDSGVTLARFLPDLPARLTGAQLSISQAGYNTIADILAARCRAVLVPYDLGGETEQTQRAGLLQARGLAQVVTASGLDGAGMARAMDAALEMPTRAAGVNLGGAERTGEILGGAVMRRLR